MDDASRYLTKETKTLNKPFTCSNLLITLFTPLVAASLASLKAACIPAVVNKLGNGFVIKNTLIKVNIFIKIIDNFIKNCSCVNNKCILEKDRGWFLDRLNGK